MSEDLVGYLLDTLDVEEQRVVEARLEHDPALRAELEALRKIVRPLAVDDLIEPPPGLSSQTFELVSRSLDKPALYSEYQAETNADWAGGETRMRAIDYVVASGILGIAATLVFPAMASLRGDQARILCAEQLRKIGIALASYQQQENSRLPFVDVSGPMNHAGSFALALRTKELLPEVKSLVCPAANNAIVTLIEPRKYLATPANSEQFEHMRRYMSGSYGYALGFREEDGKHGGYFQPAGNTPVVADRPPRSDEIQFNNSPNHQDQGQNVLYVDGNVRWIPCRVIGSDDIFRNRNCDVAAGVDRFDIVIGTSESTPFPTAGL